MNIRNIFNFAPLYITSIGTIAVYRKLQDYRTLVSVLILCKIAIECYKYTEVMEVRYILQCPQGSITTTTFMRRSGVVAGGFQVLHRS